MVDRTVTIEHSDSTAKITVDYPTFNRKRDLTLENVCDVGMLDVRGKKSAVSGLKIGHYWFLEFNRELGEDDPDVESLNSFLLQFSMYRYRPTEYIETNMKRYYVSCDNDQVNINR